MPKFVFCMFWFPAEVVLFYFWLVLKTTIFCENYSSECTCRCFCKRAGSTLLHARLVKRHARTPSRSAEFLMGKYKDCCARGVSLCVAYCTVLQIFCWVRYSAGVPCSSDFFVCPCVLHDVFVYHRCLWVFLVLLFFDRFCPRFDGGHDSYDSYCSSNNSDLLFVALSISTVLCARKVDTI